MIRKYFGEAFRDRHWLVLSAFRLFALGFAVVQMRLFPDHPRHLVQGNLLLFAAVLYTSLKMVQPRGWYQVGLANITVFVLDVSVAAALMGLTGGIESPFLLYTLAPVLSSALLLPRQATAATAGITGAYVFALFIALSSDSFTDSVSAMNDFPLYLLALASAATFPYLINSYSRQRFQSTAVLGERRRLAREIHDGVCQGIYGLRWHLQDLRRKIDLSPAAARNLQQIERLLEETEEDARGSIELLRGFDAGRPFLSQLEDHLRQLEGDTGISCRLETAVRELPLDSMIGIEAFYVCQEALRNAAKHSGARRIAVKLTPADDRVRITVTDDGCGFDATGQYALGRGLTVMRERAESVGGRLEIVSAPGQGTQIRMEVPRRWYQPLRTPRPSESWSPTTTP